MVTPHSQWQLTFRSYTTLFIGAVFVLLGGGMGWFSSQSGVEFVCDRSAEECTYTSTGPLSDTQETLALADIREAELDSRRRDDSTTYSATLHTEEGAFDLSSHRSSSRSEHEQLVQDVNEFLADADQSRLELSHAAGPWLQLFLLAFVLVGLFMLLGVRNVAEVEALPGAAMLALRRRRWWQSSGHEERLNLDEIEDVDVDTRIRRRKRGRRSRTHRAVIRMRTGDEYPVFRFYSSGRGAFRQVEQIRNLLERARSQ